METQIQTTERASEEPRSGSQQRVGMRPTVARTRTAQDEARWVDAWHMAYKWRADHWGQMPEAKYRRMIKARDRSDIAWKREREAVERTKAHTTELCRPPAQESTTH